MFKKLLASCVTLGLMVSPVLASENATKTETKPAVEKKAPVKKHYVKKAKVKKQAKKATTTKANATKAQEK